MEETYGGEKMKYLNKKNVGYALLVVGGLSLAGVTVLGQVSSALVLQGLTAVAATAVGAYLVWK